MSEHTRCTALKLAVKRSPFTSVSLLTLTVLLLMTYLMRVAEGPGICSCMCLHMLLYVSAYAPACVWDTSRHIAGPEQREQREQLARLARLARLRQLTLVGLGCGHSTAAAFYVPVGPSVVNLRDADHDRLRYASTCAPLASCCIVQVCPSCILLHRASVQRARSSLAYTIAY